MPIIEDVTYDVDNEKFQKKLIVQFYSKKRSGKMFRSENNMIRPRKIHGSWANPTSKTHLAPSSIFNIGEFQNEAHELTLTLPSGTQSGPKRKKRTNSEAARTMAKVIFHHFENYCDKTTLHGLRYVGDPSLTVAERIFWFAAFASSLAFASYYITNIFEKWNTNPVLVAFSPNDATFHEIPFPAITICNMNQVKREEAEKILREDDMQQKLLLNDYCNYSESYDKPRKQPKWNVIKQFLIRTGQSCSDTVKQCIWQNENISCDYYFNNILTDEGLCCSFNRLPPKFIYRNLDAIGDLNQTYPSNIYDWSPEKGFDSPNDGDIHIIPIRPSGSGTHLGLTLMIDAQIDNYYCSSTYSTGFKILLSNPLESPKIADFGFLISPGVEARYVIKPEIREATPTLRSVDVSKRQCYFQDEKHLRFFKYYTKRNCRLECQSNYTLTKCQCIPYYLPQGEETEYCGKNKEECVAEAKEDMELIYGNGSSCSCLPGCYEMNFDKSATYSNFTNFGLRHGLGNVSNDYFRKNMAILHFFFTDSRFRRQIKSEIYGFTEVLSNVGGLLGLCLGFSILSLVELIYYISLKLICGYMHSRKRGQKKKEKNDRYTNSVIPFMS